MFVADYGGQLLPPLPGNIAQPEFGMGFDTRKAGLPSSYPVGQLLDIRGIDQLIRAAYHFVVCAKPLLHQHGRAYGVRFCNNQSEGFGEAVLRVEKTQRTAHAGHHPVMRQRPAKPYTLRDRAYIPRQIAGVGDFERKIRQPLAQGSELAKNLRQSFVRGTGKKQAVRIARRIVGFQIVGDRIPDVANARQCPLREEFGKLERMTSRDADHVDIRLRQRGPQAAEAELAQARALASCTDAMIQKLKLEIAKLRRDKYGISSERRARLIDQLELQLEELEAAATEDALTAEAAAAADKTSSVRAFARRKPVRKPFPDHLPRERVVVEVPISCSCCGSDRIVKMGEDITETLEVIPRQWKVIQTVREKFTCRACEKISQPPAPFHAIPRGWAGPSLIAMLVFEKYGQHQPLNRQAERFAREGVELSLSTLADLIGHACVALAPIHALIERHVLEGARLHGDDTTVPLLARGGTKTARLWTYVRDDRPWDGGAPPAALFHFSTDRRKEYPS